MSDARVAQTNLQHAALPVAAPLPASSLPATVGLWLASLAGLAVLTMGLAVLVGWILGHPRLVQWQPWLPPMVYTTALALALAGGAQLLLANGSRIVAIVLVAIVVTLAVSALPWPGSGALSATVRPALDAWIEWLLVTTTVPGARPMGVPAAAGLLLVSGGLLIRAKQRPSVFCLNVARSLGVAAAILGLAGIILSMGSGAAAASPGASGAILQLLPQAGVALILLGIGLVTLPPRTLAIAGPGGATCLPACAGVASLLVTLTLWQTAQRQQQAHITGELRESAAAAQTRAVTQFEHDRRQLAYIGQQMAIVSDEWPRKGPTSWPASGLERWLRASEPYLTGQPSHRAALWIDEQLRVAGVNGADDLVLHGVDLGADVARGAELRAAIATGEEGEEIVLRADDLLRGRPTLLLAQSIRGDDGQVGFAAGLVDLDTMFRMILHDEEARGFAFEVGDAAGPIYRTDMRQEARIGGRPAIPAEAASAAGGSGDRRGAAPPPSAGAPSHRVPLMLSSVGLTLQVTPSARLFERNLGLVSEWALAFGLLATVLLTATVYAAQVARRRSAAQERLNAALGEQIAHRHEVERELQQATADLQYSNLELKQASADLQQSNRELEQTTAELQRSNRELEQFASVASHDLRAPLQKVRSFAELLEQDHESQLGDEGRDFLQRLKRSVTRMEGLVDDLLTLARVRAKGRPFTQVDLAVIVRDVLSDFEGTLRETGGRVEVGELPAIDADPTQMHQLIQNLLGNGLKFRRAGEPPVVQISARIVENGAAASVHGPACQLRVSDNGIGFDDRHADRIFKPFERLHGPQHYEGSGIGLAVCARIAERHGGTIAASSRPGEGAVFTVTLPLHHVKVGALPTRRT